MLSLHGISRCAMEFPVWIEWHGHGMVLEYESDLRLPDIRGVILGNIFYDILV
jgi:hypothetical protein